MLKQTKRKKYNVAVVGATGAVGSEMLRVLQQQRFPINRLCVLASTRSVGRRVSFNGSSYRVERLNNRAFNGIDVALFSAGASRNTPGRASSIRWPPSVPAG